MCIISQPCISCRWGFGDHVKDQSAIPVQTVTNFRSDQKLRIPSCARQKANATAPCLNTDWEIAFTSLSQVKIAPAVTISTATFCPLEVLNQITATRPAEPTKIQKCTQAAVIDHILPFGLELFSWPVWTKRVDSSTKLSCGAPELAPMRKSVQQCTCWF